MFDILGFWFAASVFCLPPIIFISAIALEFIRTSIRKESGYTLDFPFYFKFRKVFGDVDMVGLIFIFLMASMPMFSLTFIYFVDYQIKMADLTYLQWLSHCCAWWAPVGAWVAVAFTTMLVARLAVKGYVKLVVLTERVKQL